MDTLIVTNIYLLFPFLRPAIQYLQLPSLEKSGCVSPILLFPLRVSCHAFKSFGIICIMVLYPLIQLLFRDFHNILQLRKVIKEFI